MSRTVTAAPAPPVGGGTMSTDDRVRTFVNQLKVLATASFQELFTMAKSKYAHDATARVAVFHKCLVKIEDWDASVRAEEMQRAMEQFPGIREDYRHAAVTFVRSLGLGPAKRGKLPPFDMFLFYYFRAVARSVEMRQQQFFAMDYVARHAFFSDMLNLVLNSCVHVVDGADPPPAPAPSVPPAPLVPSVTPAPLVPSVAPVPPAAPSVAPAAPSVAPAPSAAPVAAASVAASVSPAAAPARAHPAWTAATTMAAPATLVSYSSRVHDGPILPSDSVSNVGRPSRRVAAAPAKALSVARQSVRLIDTSTASNAAIPVPAQSVSDEEDDE